MNGYCLHCDRPLTGDEFEFHPQCHPDRPKGNGMIRTAQQWLSSPEHDTLAKGGTLAAFIEAVQRNAVEASAVVCNGRVQGTKDWAREDSEALSCAANIRALIPTAPSKPKKETPGGAMDESGAVETRGYTTKEVDQIRANAYRAGFADAVEACYGRCVEEGLLAKASDNESALALCNWIGQRIRALIPTAPGTPRPGEPSKSQPHRTSRT